MNRKIIIAAVAALLASTPAIAYAGAVTYTTATTSGTVGVFNGAAGLVQDNSGVVPLTNITANKILGNNTGSAAGIAEIGVTGTFGSVVLSNGPTIDTPLFTGIPQVTQGQFNIQNTGGYSSLVLKRLDDPGSGDYIGYINWTALNSTSTSKTYGWLYGKVTDDTNGSEDMSFLFAPLVNGTVTVAATIGTGLSVGAPTGGLKGTGTVNATGYYANGTVGVSCAAASVTLATLVVTNGIVTHC